MRDVVIIGAGLTQFGERWEASFRQLIAEAGVRAIESAELDGKEIQAVYGGTMASGRFIGQEHIGALIVDQLGLNPIPSVRIEGACASGSLALRAGFMDIASGKHDIVAVGGAEKMTEVSTEDVGFVLGGAGDQETELFHGATFPSLYALMARAHMQRYGTTEEQMASCAVKNHKNAVHNEYAQYRKEITIDDVMNSGYVSEPLKLFDCSPISDGAAAVILASKEKAQALGIEGVQIIASAQASDTLALAQRKSLTELNAAKVAATDAYKQAGVRAKDINVAEVHDCFTIAEVMAIEDLGFFKKGEGGPASLEGRTALNGEIAINTSGGLKGAGHPVGATGVKQAAEMYWQLLGKAGKRQVNSAEIGLTHNVGGSGATCVIHIFKRM